MATQMDKTEIVEEAEPSEAPINDHTELTIRVAQKGTIYEVRFYSSGARTEVTWNESFRSVWEVKGFLNERWPETATQTLPDGKVIQLPFRQALINIIDSQMAAEQANEMSKITRTEQPYHPSDDMKSRRKSDD